MEVIPVVAGELWEFFDRDAIDTRSSFICFYPLPCPLHVFPRKHPFQQVDIWGERFHDAPLGHSSGRIHCVLRAHRGIPFTLCLVLHRVPGITPGVGLL